MSAQYAYALAAGNCLVADRCRSKDTVLEVIVVTLILVQVEGIVGARVYFPLRTSENLSVLETGRPSPVL